MKCKKLILFLMFILLVPFVSASILDGISGMFSKIKILGSGWDPGYTAVGILVFVLIVMAFIGRRIAHHKGNIEGNKRRYGSEERGLFGLALGALGGLLWRHKWKPARAGWRAGKRGLEWRRVRKDRQLEKNQEEINERIDARIGEISEAKDTLNQEEIILDNRLHKVEGEAKDLLEQSRKKIEPVLINIGNAIAKIQVDYENGRFSNPESIKQSLQLLWQEFNAVKQKHTAILERYDGLIRAEAQLIIEKEDRQRRETANLQEEVRDGEGELVSLSKEAIEAYDELVALKKANADPKDIAIQKKKFKDINRARRNVKKELKDAKKEGAKDKKAEDLEHKLLEKLKRQRELTALIRQAENNMTNANAQANAQSATRWIKIYLDEMRKNRRYIRRKIRELAKIDRKNERLERRAERLERIRKHYGKKVKKMGKKEERVEARTLGMTGS